MARKINRLSTKSIAAAKARGYYADGGGLYLQVSQAGTKSWIFRYFITGKTLSKAGRPMNCDMGLGSANTVTLAEAREKATAYRKLLVEGIDPRAARAAGAQQQALEAAKTITFQQCAVDYIKENRAKWKNEKHAEQWTNTLSAYAYPEFGKLPVQAIETGLVLRALRPIWTEKHETATRVRARIESVLSAATAMSYRTGDNPARWRGHLDKLLPKIEKRKRVKHHAALPFDDIGGFMASLRTQKGMAARALEFVILTATRTGDAVGASWSEIDMGAAVWTIPAERMKAHREHRVPLSPRAVAILKAMEEIREGDYIFPSERGGKPLSNMAMLALLERMERDDITVHGFRSTFRDWTAERTNFPQEVCEMALAHVVANQAEAAYRRGDLFDKRRALMEAWAQFCVTPRRDATLVISLQANAA